MSKKQPTLKSFLSSGYETDNGTTTQPRRSSRVVTPARQEPGMIGSSSESRRGLFDLELGRDVRDEHVHCRRERSTSLPGGNLELGEQACALVSLLQGKGTSTQNRPRERSVSVSEAEIVPSIKLPGCPRQTKAQTGARGISDQNQNRERSASVSEVEIGPSTQSSGRPHRLRAQTSVTLPEIRDPLPRPTVDLA